MLFDYYVKHQDIVFQNMKLKKQLKERVNKQQVMVYKQRTKGNEKNVKTNMKWLY